MWFVKTASPGGVVQIRTASAPMAFSSANVIANGGVAFAADGSLWFTGRTAAGAARRSRR